MIRKPSIHIYLSDLEYLINKNSGNLLNEIIRKSKTNPVKRTVVLSNAKININDSVDLFNRTLEAERYVGGHKAVKQIFKTDKSYNLLVDISKDADDFCRVFDLDISEGFVIYCKYGLRVIGRNYSLNKFKTYKDKIFQSFERFQLMDNSPNIDFAIDCCNYYLDKVGITEESQLVNVWNNFGHDFIYLADQIIDSYDFVRWIDSQFESVAYLNIVPEPYQLHGEEAMKRYLLKSKNINNKQARDNSWRKKVKDGLHEKIK